MEAKIGYANINGARLYYELAGSGPTLALLHGFTLDTRMWDSQFEPFTQRCQVLRYDLRGFGRSALPQAEVYEPVEDLRALLEVLGIERAALLGISMGGGVAIDFALVYPEKVNALISVDAAVNGYPWSFQWDPQVKQVGILGAKQRWLEHALFAHARRQPAVFARLEEMVSG